jgi:hypothetical protein
MCLGLAKCPRSQREHPRLDRPAEVAEGMPYFPGDCIYHRLSNSKRHPKLLVAPLRGRCGRCRTKPPERKEARHRKGRSSLPAPSTCEHHCDGALRGNPFGSNRSCELGRLLPQEVRFLVPLYTHVGPPTPPLFIDARSRSFSPMSEDAPVWRMLYSTAPNTPSPSVLAASWNSRAAVV